MQNPAPVDIYGDRWVACIRQLPILGIDLTDATFAAHVRPTRDYPGVPLIQLSTVSGSTTQGIRLIYSGTDTIANHIAAGRLSGVPLGYANTDTVTMSLLGIRVDIATMQFLPLPTESIGDDIQFYWDLQITPSGGDKDVYARGVFVVRAGATE